MTDSTIPEEAIRAWILADSDRRDSEQERLLNNWHAGWRAAEIALDDAYEEGFVDGFRHRARFQRDAATEVANERKRWGPGGREHFADPRPGDYQGGPVTPC